MAIKAEVPATNTDSNINLSTTQGTTHISVINNQEALVGVYVVNSDGVPQLTGYRVPLKWRVTYRCDVCNKEFVSPDYLRTHTCVHTGERSDQSDDFLPKPQVQSTHSGEHLFV